MWTIRIYIWFERASEYYDIKKRWTNRNKEVICHALLIGQIYYFFCYMFFPVFFCSNYKRFKLMWDRWKNEIIEFVCYVMFLFAHLISIGTQLSIWCKLYIECYNTIIILIKTRNKKKIENVCLSFVWVSWDAQLNYHVRKNWNSCKVYNYRRHYSANNFLINMLTLHYHIN